MHPIGRVLGIGNVQGPSARVDCRAIPRLSVDDSTASLMRACFGVPLRSQGPYLQIELTTHDTGGEIRTGLDLHRGGAGIAVYGGSDLATTETVRELLSDGIAAADTLIEVSCRDGLDRGVLMGAAVFGGRAIARKTGEALGNWLVDLALGK